MLYICAAELIPAVHEDARTTSRALTAVLIGIASIGFGSLAGVGKKARLALRNSFYRVNVSSPGHGGECSWSRKRSSRKLATSVLKTVW
jgi:hypothetical protein